MEEAQRMAKKQLKTYYQQKVQVLKGVIKVSSEEYSQFLDKVKSQVKALQEAYFEQSPENTQIADDYEKNLEKEAEKILERLKTALPVYAIKPEIISALKDYRIVIVMGNPGCGKSTQIPQYLLEITESRNKNLSSTSNSGFDQVKPQPISNTIYVSLPRKVAARNLSVRLNDELKYAESQKKIVEFNPEMSDQDIKNSLIVFGSDIELYTLLSQTPEKLSLFKTIVIDEANLRHIFADMIISMLKKQLKHNPVLQLVVLCTNIDQALYSRFFDDGLTKEMKTIEIRQPNYPTEMNYLGQNSNEPESS